MWPAASRFLPRLSALLCDASDATFADHLPSISGFSSTSLVLFEYSCRRPPSLEDEGGSTGVVFLRLGVRTMSGGGRSVDGDKKSLDLSTRPISFPALLVGCVSR